SRRGARAPRPTRGTVPPSGGARTPRGPRTRIAHPRTRRCAWGAWSPRPRRCTPAGAPPAGPRACPCPPPKGPRSRAGTRPERSGTGSRSSADQARAGRGARSLRILDLLANPLDLFLHDDHRARHADVVALRADGVDLAVHLL